MHKMCKTVLYRLLQQAGSEPTASQASHGHAAAFASAGMAMPPPRAPSRDGMDAPQVEGAALELTVRLLVTYHS